MLRELTKAEKVKPIAKYFYRPMTPAKKEIYDLLDKGPIDPSLALNIINRNELLNPGYLPCERGFCLMPDGTGFIAKNDINFHKGEKQWYGHINIKPE